jgi:hypothetical protein
MSVLSWTKAAVATVTVAATTGLAYGYNTHINQRALHLMRVLPLAPIAERAARDLYARDRDTAIMNTARIEVNTRWFSSRVCITTTFVNECEYLMSPGYLHHRLDLDEAASHALACAAQQLAQYKSSPEVKARAADTVPPALLQDEWEAIAPRLPKVIANSITTTVQHKVLNSTGPERVHTWSNECKDSACLCTLWS